MKQRIDKYIPLALSAIRSQIAVGTDEVDERYDGYASSLGPAIITSGLKTAIAFYTDKHRGGSSGPRRFHILKIITHILNEDGEAVQNAGNDNALLHHLLNMNDVETVKDKIMDAIIAIKLSFRNFKHIKTTEA